MSNSLRIFVVENHADTLACLQMYLEDLGHTVLSAQSLAEALAKFPTSRCNLLISDIGLPDGTGWELLEKLELPKSFFAVAMSGFGANADTRRSHAAGFRHHLIKPFNPDELDRLLEKASSQAAKA